MKEKKTQIRPGFCVGKLTVTEATPERKSGYTIWRCTCECGGSICLDTRTLQRGTVRDCGCESVVKPGQRDITGQRFGKLTALYPIDEKDSSGSLIWHCKCDCGGEVDAPLGQLRAGYRKSCGCLSRPPLKDFVGKRFGKLVVQKYAGKWGGLHHWLCICDCGNQTIVGQTALQSGKTQSCGCLKKETYRENLKLVDGTSVAKLEASCRHRLISSNSSGYNGVYRNERSGRWTAQITFKGKKYYLGSFKDIGDAVKVRKEAEKRMYGEFLEWYYKVYRKKEKLPGNTLIL